MAIIPENSLYVQANFKETQIEKMHIGQKVKLKLDAYPSLNFTGKIESFLPLQARLSHLCHQTMPQATLTRLYSVFLYVSL